VPAPAAAEARPPRITERPVVAGTPQVGATLAAQGAEWDGRPEPVVTWQWVRCDGPGADTRSVAAPPVAVPPAPRPRSTPTPTFDLSG
jgi:hypothetical protein